MNRIERLQKIVAGWPDAADPADIGRLTEEFLAAYGEFAYLCPEQFHLGGVATTEELANLAGLRPGEKILDVACFLGGPARYLATRYAGRVTGLDIDPAVVAAAAKLTAYLGLTGRVEFVVGDALHLPFPDASYDAVWGQDAWPHRPGLFAECARVLRPGGVIAFTNSVLGVNGDLDGEVVYEAYTADEYAVMLAEAGFTVLVREDISSFAAACWTDLLTGMERDKENLKERLGWLRYQREKRELAGIVDDYRRGRIAHCRFVARKKR